MHTLEFMIVILSQFHLSVGVIGAVYLASTVMYVLGSILSGPLTDKLVRGCELLPGQCVCVATRHHHHILERKRIPECLLYFLAVPFLRQLHCISQSQHVLIHTPDPSVPDYYWSGSRSCRVCAHRPTDIHL